MITSIIPTILLNVFLALPPMGSPVCDSIAERENDTLTADTVAKIISNDEQITDSVVIDYWNVWGRNYTDYYIIYSPYKKEIVVYTSMIKTPTGWIKSPYRLVINSYAALQYFNKAISSFFITKSKTIIEKKSPKNEIISTDYPTLSFDIYNYNGKKVRSVSVKIDEEDCSPIFTIEFTEFIDFINDLTKKHDQMIDRRNNQDTYRCRIK